MCDTCCCRALHVLFELIHFTVGGGFLFVGVFLLKLNHPTVIIVRACETNLGRDMVVRTASFGFLFGVLLIMTSVMGIVGTVRKSPHLLHTYAVILYILVTFMAFFFSFLYFHVDMIKHKLTFCLNRVIPELYQGPWKTDPASFSYALDKYQYETGCCAADSYKVYQTFVGWNKTHWNTPLKHFDGYNQGASQQNPAAARKPILLIPWTCCKFRKDKKKPKYDPGLSLKELEASLVDPSCTYRVTTTSVNLLPCSPSIQDQLKQISFVFILVVDTLLFCNIVRCMIGIYGAKAYRYQKNK